MVRYCHRGAGRFRGFLVGIDVTPEIGDADLLGKKASDLQTGVKITGNEISGTLKYVSGYTGFHGSDPAQQEGNFLALKVDLDPADADCTFELLGGTSNKGPVDLTEDGLIVLRITDKATQKLKIVATKDGESSIKTYGLSGLTLTAKPTVRKKSTTKR